MYHFHVKNYVDGVLIFGRKTAVFNFRPIETKHIKILTFDWLKKKNGWKTAVGRKTDVFTLLVFMSEGGFPSFTTDVHVTILVTGTMGAINRVLPGSDTLLSESENFDI